MYPRSFRIGFGCYRSRLRIPAVESRIVQGRDERRTMQLRTKISDALRTRTSDAAQANKANYVNFHLLGFIHVVMSFIRPLFFLACLDCRIPEPHIQMPGLRAVTESIPA